MATIKTVHNIGDIVYLVTDVDQLDRIVTGICIKPCGITYELANGSHSRWHYDIELSTEKNVLKTLTND